MWEGTTVLGRLLGQLAGFGIPDIRVLTRPAWEAGVRAVAGAWPVISSPDTAADLRTVAAAASEPGAAIVVLPGEVVAHGEALAGLLKDPRVATAALLGGASRSRQFAYRVRSKRRRVLSAASPYHAVHHPTSTFLGVLKVAAVDRPRLAEAAARLAELTDDPPEEWREELERKAAMWRTAQWRAANRPRDDEEDLLSEEPVAQAPEEVVLSPQDEARLSTRLAAAPEDTVALLLTALVRSGAEVGGHRLRKLFWDRPLSAEAVAEAQERIRDYDEDKVLLESAVKARDGFFTTFFVSPYSRYIARWAGRRGFTPNQVTTA